MPEPDQQAWRYLDGDDAWRYVAPDRPGRLYDAAYFDGRYFVLHGNIENDKKVTLSEINWLSWTRDGSEWDTITLTEQPYDSYTRLASNGESLLLAGSRHVGQLIGDEVVPIGALDQRAAPPVLLPYPSGLAIARQDDVLWLDSNGSIEVVLEQSLAQFRAGVARPPGERSILTGPFGAFASTDGKRWTPEAAPCEGCNVVGIAFGNERYLAADVETFYVSSAGESWEASAWPLANPPASTPADERTENRIARIDFTGGHFVAALEGGNTRLSLDGVNWGEQLKIPLGQIGPAPCNGRCYVAGGHILRAPRVLPDPEPPPGADESSPYYCEYLGPPDGACVNSSCGGATVDECHEGVRCMQRCETSSDCPAADSGRPRIECSQTQIGGQCDLFCDRGESCPNGMSCVGGTCLYVFDDPRCI